MNQDLRELRRAATTDLTVDTLAEVKDTGPDDEPPGLITKTVFSGVEGEGEGVIGVHGVTHETTGCVGVQGNHEEKCQVMGVPESLEALLANLLMCGSVHQEHDQKHEMTGDTTGLPVVDVLGANLSDFWFIAFVSK